MQKKPHEYAELIKLWADGAEIEYKFVNGAVNIWLSVANPPWNNEDLEFRIKPEPKPDKIIHFQLGKLNAPKGVINEHYRVSGFTETKSFFNSFNANGFEYDKVSDIKVVLDVENNRVKEITWD